MVCWRPLEHEHTTNLAPQNLVGQARSSSRTARGIIGDVEGYSGPAARSGKRRVR
jgi:hypothetical protein